MKWIYSTFFFAFALFVSAQDFHLTQFYAIPLNLNPAFAGTSDQDFRIASLYRNQWNATSGFNTSLFSADTDLGSDNTGIGVLFFNDRQGEVGLRHTSISAVGSYGLTLSENWELRGGINLSANFFSLDVADALFPDQISSGGISPVIGREDFSGRDLNANFIDLGLGGLLYSQSFWLGLSSKYLSRPSTGILDEDYRIPMFFSVHSGYRINLAKPGRFQKPADIPKKYLIPAIHYRFQDGLDQLDLGAYYVQEPLLVGLWYRGLTNFGEAELTNRDALAVLLGVQIDYLKIGYSYDFTVLQMGYSLGGAHEISVSYNFNAGGAWDRKLPKHYKRIPCPAM